MLKVEQLKERYTKTFYKRNSVYNNILKKMKIQKV